MVKGLRRLCGGWGENEIKLNVAKLELEIGLSLAKMTLIVETQFCDSTRKLIIAKPSPAQAGTETEVVSEDNDFSAMDSEDENIHTNSTLASQTRRNNKWKLAVHTIYSFEYI